MFTIKITIMSFNFFEGKNLSLCLLFYIIKDLNFCDCFLYIIIINVQ